MSEFDKISIYVDGSCLENQNVSKSTPAAWAVVIVIGDSGLGKGTGEIHEEFLEKLKTVLLMKTLKIILVQR